MIRTILSILAAALELVPKLIELWQERATRRTAEQLEAERERKKQETAEKIKDANTTPPAS